MVEVYAEILRGPGAPVYLTGEEIECEISFRNIEDSSSTSAAQDNKNAKSKKNKIEVLAWACAQISCQCYINETKVILPKSRAQYQKEIENIEKGTSFMPNKGENGIIIYSSKPKILFCDLKLEPNVSKSFIYKEKIPFELPPSYRGQLVKYLYKLTIGTQQLNCSTQLLRVPFRVITIKDFNKHLAKYNRENSVSSEKTYESDLDLSNPFIIIDKNKEDNLEYILEVLQDLTAKKQAHVFNITNNNGRVVKLTLFKLDFKIGDDIVGLLDFSESDVACVEYMVSLYCEEQVLDECKKKQNQGNFSESQSYQKDFVLFLKNTSFSLQVPVVATPTFGSDIVNLQWSLNFDFMISPNKLPNIEIPSDSTQDSIWQPPNTINTEKMSWTLPISVYPTSPLTLSNVCTQTDVNRLVL